MFRRVREAPRYAGSAKIKVPDHEIMALAVLLLVFLFVVFLITMFIFPPTRWVKSMTKNNKK
jgi:hypothetical protein